MARKQSKIMTAAEIKAGVVSLKQEIKKYEDETKVANKGLSEAQKAHEQRVKEAGKKLAIAQKEHDAAVKESAKQLAAVEKSASKTSGAATVAKAKAESKLQALQEAKSAAAETAAA